ncbi:MAG TPA: ABC transporter ATP-binding protein [Vicinamibacterales bacterium]|nr:ABC transporter ATP-binding protein [Vicinamibacterales bacterium]
MLRPHWLRMAAALVAVVFETLADVLEPWPVAIVVDHVLGGKPLPRQVRPVVDTWFGTDPAALLEFALAAIIVIAIVGGIASYVQKYLTTTVSQWVAHDLRLTLYNRIQRLSLAEHGRSRVGDLVMRVTKDVDAVQDFIDTALLGLVVNALTLAGMVTVMLLYNWRFTLVGLSVAPVLSVFVYFYSRRVKAASRVVKKKESELLSNVAEKLTSIQVIQAFAREEYEDRHFSFDSRDSVRAGLQARSIKAKLSPMVDLIVAAGTCIVLLYGVRLISLGQLSTGVLILFLMYLKKTYKPIKDLSKMVNTLSKAAVSYERIQEVIELESAIRDRPDARVAPPFRGLIEFDRVTFGYDRDTIVLKDVSFRIEPGQKVAIVGPSGMGKSTIASLVPRFFDPLSGVVRIDGVDVREYTLTSLRDQLGFVLQDSLLFSGTIWDNISYGRPDADPEDTIRAAQLANAHDFIVGLRQGYGTPVGERGATLSGGQRRRIAIARAMVRNSPILILDEPTTGLDAGAERAVVEALERLMEGRTCLVIAHHLDTIRSSDLILVVKDAEIVERGTHLDLIAAGGVYYELYMLQARQQEPHATPARHEQAFGSPEAR